MVYCTPVGLCWLAPPRPCNPGERVVLAVVGDTMGLRYNLRPPVPGKQLVHIRHRDLPAERTLDNRSYFRGPGHISVLCPLNKRPENFAFLRQTEKRPASPASTPPLEPCWAFLVVLANPQPNRLDRNPQNLRHLVGVQSAFLGQPDRHTSFVGRLIR